MRTHIYIYKHTYTRTRTTQIHIPMYTHMPVHMPHMHKLTYTHTDTEAQTYIHVYKLCKNNKMKHKIDILNLIPEPDTITEAYLLGNGVGARQHGGQTS